jgi:hypothetical protein
MNEIKCHVHVDNRCFKTGRREKQAHASYFFILFFASKGKVLQVSIFGKYRMSDWIIYVFARQKSGRFPDLIITSERENTHL